MSFLFFCAVIALTIVDLSFANELRQVRKIALKNEGFKVQNIAAGSTFPASPTYGIVEYYADSACTVPMYGSSTLLNTCLASSADSAIYTCDANGLATKTTYTDTTCTAGASADTLTVGDCTAAGGGQYMKAVACGSDATAFDTKFILNSVYEQSGCSQLIGVGGQANDYCFQVNDNPVNSIEWKWPKGYSYATTDCTGTPLGSVTFSTTCQNPDPTDIDDYVFYNSYTQYSYSSAFSNLSFGFGVLFSTILAALQLIKN